MKKTHKSNILTIMQKEFRRFFGDRRMVMTLLLPGILIYIIYSLLGSTLSSGFSESDSTTDHRIWMNHRSETVHAYMVSMAEATGNTFGYDEHDDPIAAVEAELLDIYIDLPADFDEQVAAYTPASGKPAPEVKIYYKSSSTSSQAAFSFMVASLDLYESTLSNRMDINRDSSVTYDLATPADLTGMIFSMLMPLLLIMLMFSGCMAMTTESIAGEKERGTIATLLVTPVKRSELAVGKIAALSVISLLAGLSSFLGVLLSLPKLMGAEGMDGMVDASVYSLNDYALLLPVILSTVLVFVSVIATLSALASSVKEAGGYVTPLMLVVTVISASGMLTGGSDGLLPYFIPVYNSIQCISGVFSMHGSPLGILITVLVNFATAGLFAFVLTRMFHSERLMFKK